MTVYKSELSIEDIGSEWKMLTTINSHVWYKLEQNRFLPKGTYIQPEPYSLLKYLKEIYKYQYLVPSVSLFENNNRLSTQAPMKHIYYTDCYELLEWNEHLGCVEVRHFEYSWELERLQKLVLG